MPSPKVTAAGPFVMPPSPEPPVATRWLLTPAEFAECDHSVLHRCDPAQVDFGVMFYPPFIASSFLLEVYLVPNHCGSRAPPGLKFGGPFVATVRRHFVVA